MPLVHKSVDVRPEVWKKLRVHAELSNSSLRDYLTYLIETSHPVNSTDDLSQRALNVARRANALAPIR